MKRILNNFIKVILVSISIFLEPLIIIYISETISQYKYIPFGYKSVEKNYKNGFQYEGGIFKYYYSSKNDKKIEKNKYYKKVEDEIEFIVNKIDTLYIEYEELLDSEIIFDKNIISSEDYYYIREVRKDEFYLYYFDVNESILYYIVCLG